LTDSVPSASSARRSNPRRISSDDLTTNDEQRPEAIYPMEPLRTPVVATGGNQRQIDGTLKPRKQAKSVATGCNRLPETFPW
jgi:hypothetical protein